MPFSTRFDRLWSLWLGYWLAGWRWHAHEACAGVRRGHRPDVSVDRGTGEGGIVNIRRWIRKALQCQQATEDWRPRVNRLDSRVADLASMEHRIAMLEGEQVFLRKLLSDLLAGKVPGQ